MMHHEDLDSNGYRTLCYIPEQIHHTRIMTCVIDVRSDNCSLGMSVGRMGSCGEDPESRGLEFPE